MTLSTAFKQSLYQRGLLTSIGYSKHQIAKMKVRHKIGGVSVELMRKVARDAGYECIQAEEWAT